MIEIIIIAVLVSMVIAEGIIIRRKMAQNNRYQNVLTSYETWIENFTLTIASIDSELDRLDDAGTFRSDDEIGFFFQAIYSVLKKLSEYGLIDDPDEKPQEPVEYPNEITEKDKTYNRVKERNRLGIDMSDVQNLLKK